MLRRSKTDDGAPVAAEGAHVLVVHDDPDAGRTVARLFEARGFRSSMADGVEGGVDVLLSGADVDVVIADLRHGGTSEALRLLDEIRSLTDAGLAHTRVVVTTDIDENRMFSWQSGVDGFLVRPFHADDLVGAVDAALSRDDAARAEHRQAQMQVAAEPPRRAAGDDG